MALKTAAAALALSALLLPAVSPTSSSEPWQMGLSADEDQNAAFRAGGIIVWCEFERPDPDNVTVPDCVCAASSQQRRVAVLYGENARSPWLNPKGCRGLWGQLGPRPAVA